MNAPLAARPVWKLATEPWEFVQIDHLNHRTFVEEIPQHQPHPNGRLTDRFHRDNTYIVCIADRRLVGMLAVRGTRPFSLDAKLEGLDRYLPAHQKPCEIRLLAVAKPHRGGAVLAGLIRRLYAHCLDQGYDLAVISGTIRQLKLYTHLGFVPFGPLVGGDQARFQPMYLTREAFRRRGLAVLARPRSARAAHPPLNLLPGPVALHSEVQAAFAATPVSHRSPQFVSDFQQLRAGLCRLVNTRAVEIMAGSGTTANDAIAAQLSRVGTPGLILSNGEFGERLVRHARGFGLKFDVLIRPWGHAFGRADFERAMDRRPGLGWVWAVHAETSTGVLNDLELLRSSTLGRDVRLCLDCVSSIGSIPVDLDGVALASCVSGKGLRGFPGLALVFHREPIEPDPRLPCSLDVGTYAARDGVPFTLSSNLLAALRVAVGRCEAFPPYQAIHSCSRRLRTELRRRGFDLIAPDGHNFPAVITIALPRSAASERVGGDIEIEGVLVSHRSPYLVARNWIQICLMGELSPETLVSLPEALERVVSRTALHTGIAPRAPYSVRGIHPHPEERS